MVLEVAILNVRRGQGEAFEASFLKAQRIISASPGYQRHELRRCLETPDRYLLLVWWDSLESHTEGFRRSPAYEHWRQLLHGFYDPFPEVEHYTALANGRRIEMTAVPTGTELARPFMPARDFDLSKRFYEALGFEKVLDDEVAIFGTGSGGFILTRFYQKEMAENFMMQLMVDDLDAWWAHIDTLDLPGRFGVPAPRAPALQPWGLRVAFLVDPSGVLWHVAERREGAVQD
jgi:heme-degrading monooxygenase HmoA/catechol 2,3-dioxygenase-like lactoylglutathione lyase family enzyme